VLAVAGVADPAKFHATLRSLGAVIAELRSFPDHHPFSEVEAAEILACAARHRLRVVMTEKDLVRLPQQGKRGELAHRTCTVAIRLVVDAPQRLDALLRRLWPAP
jgi:tetraacyldisaccharide 4'-kinase